MSKLKIKKIALVEYLTHPDTNCGVASVDTKNDAVYYQEAGYPRLTLWIDSDEFKVTDFLREEEVEAAATEFQHLREWLGERNLIVEADNE